jgi:hypothetical protein
MCPRLTALGSLELRVGTESPEREYPYVVSENRAQLESSEPDIRPEVRPHVSQRGNSRLPVCDATFLTGSRDDS